MILSTPIKKGIIMDQSEILELESVSMVLVQITLEYLSGYTEDINSLLNTCKIDKNHIHDKDARIPMTQYYDLLKHGIAISENPYFGLNFGEKNPSHKGGHFLYYMMMNSPDLKTALENLCDYSCIIACGIQPQLVEENDFIKIVCTSSCQDQIILKHILESLFSGLVTFIKKISDNTINPVEIKFKHELTSNLDEYNRVFGNNTSFGNEQSQLIFQKKTGFQPIFLADNELLTILKKHSLKIIDRDFSSSEWTYKVSKEIKNMIHAELPGIDTVAGKLGVATRTLQVKLKNENTTFKTIQSSIRKEIAITYLQSDYPIVEIAFLLGFTEQSVFNHAFKRWTGKTPMEFRR